MTEIRQAHSETIAPGSAFNDPPFVLPASVELREGIVFDRPAGHELCLDLFAPKTRAEGAPGLVFVFGGGWRAGTTKQFWRQAAHCAALGWPSACLSYRLTPDFRFPSQLEDVQAGVRWLRGHAHELGVNPERMGAVGGSAGGHLAALLGTTDCVVEGIHSRVQAVVAFNGVFSFPELSVLPAQSPIRALLGDDPAVPAQASPLHHVDEHAAPTLLLHGSADETVPIAQSIAFQCRLQEHGVLGELFVAESAVHGFFNRPPFFQPTLERLVRFLRAQLAESRSSPGNLV